MLPSTWHQLIRTMIKTHPYCIIKTIHEADGGENMEHAKTWHQLEHYTPNGIVVIEGPVTSAQLDAYHFHEHLTTFRASVKQFAALKDIARLPEGRIIIARTPDTIIGYAAYLYPDRAERWSEFAIDHLLVLGGIEVIPEYREAKVASGLLNVSMLDDH